MRFHDIFMRQVGGASTDPLLGSDAVPTLLTDQHNDNVLNSAFSNMNGWAISRLAVTYAYTGAGVALNLTADVFIWEDVTLKWYKLNAGPLTLKPGFVQFFDCIGLPQHHAETPSGSLEAYVRVIPAGGDPVGIYTFALAPVLTSIGV